MPRPPTIPWEKRVQVFLEFRRLKKVYPTAKRHRIARSTVNVIVKEFVDNGFSEAPRVDLSPSLLALAQQHHRTEMVERLGKGFTPYSNEPSQNMRARMTPEEALADDALAKVAELHPPILEENLLWHLRRTEANRTVQEVRQALRHYDQLCLSLWLDIRQGLEGACRLVVYASLSPKAGKKDRGIYYTLVDRVYRDIINAPPQSEGPPDYRKEWRYESERSVLQLHGENVIIGGEEVSQAVQRGTEDFLEQIFPIIHRRAIDLTHQYRDLEYLSRIVSDSLKKIKPEEVRSGICPGCPYPEISQDSNPDNKVTGAIKEGNNG